MVSFHNSILLILASLSLASAFCDSKLCNQLTFFGRTNHPNAIPISHSKTQLYARGIKKGSLRKNVDGTNINDIAIAKPQTQKKSKQQNEKKMAPLKKSSNSGISPSLAQWASSNKSTSTTKSMTDNTLNNEEEEVVVPMYTSFEEEDTSESKSKSKSKKNKKKNTSERRSRQAQRNKEQELIRQKTQAIVIELEELLDVESNRDMDAILGKIRQLTESYDNNNNSNIGNYENISSTMKALSSGQKRRDYRMVWAGSDEAICHVGTGLHKVPLARLQVSKKT